MMNTFFDLEIKKSFEEIGYTGDKDKEKLRNAGMSVAAILSDKNEPIIFEEHEIPVMIKEMQKADIIIGHNILNFDYYVLSKYVDAETIESIRKKTFDTLEYMTKKRNGFKKGLGLAKLAELNLGIKKDIDGKEMPRLWREDKKDIVKKHVSDDVLILKHLYRKGKEEGKILYEHFDYGQSKGAREMRVEWN